MSKIRIGSKIIDLALCTTINITASHIHFEGGGSYSVYRNGTDLSETDFNTLSTWLTNQTNNPYTVVI